MPIDNNSNANSGAGIREGMEVNGLDWMRDGAANEGLGELVTPPLQVFIKMTDGVMWHERT
jgi:hypothetical protein